MKRMLVILAFKILNHYGINTDIKRNQIISVIGIPFKVDEIKYEINATEKKSDSVEIKAKQLKIY